MSISQRLLAEAVRYFERLSNQIIADETANQAARANGGEFEQRLINRAQALAVAEPIQAALQQWRSLTMACLALGLLLAMLAGITTARLALPATTEPLNFFWVLGSLLILPSTTLLLWLLLLLFQPRSSGQHSLGALGYSLVRRLLQRWHPDHTHLAAIQARTQLLNPAAGGHWALSGFSHALWLAYLTGSLIMAAFLLSVQQYQFIWQTTILSANTYTQLTELLAYLPALLGFTTPIADQISTGQGLAAASAWSSLLLGCIVAYGIVPRTILLLLCVVLRRRRLEQFHLDTEHPDYARLRAQLLPDIEKTGVIDPDEGIPEPEIRPPTRPAHQADRTGPIALLGLEIEQPHAGWPPLSHEDWLDLGLVVDRHSRRAALEQLSNTDPSQLLVVSSLALTPDRGLQNFLATLCQTTDAPTRLLLSQGQRLRDRNQAELIPQRLADWQKLAAAAGIDEQHVIAIDLDHLTAHSRTQLSQQLGLQATKPKRSPQACLDVAFELIIRHSQSWSGQPDTKAQSQLQQSIAQQFEHQPSNHLNLANLNKLKTHTSQALQDSAERWQQLLPLRLRTQPRWLAAGALAGACGCVAIAALTSPAAIATLPIWSALGSVLAAFKVNIDSESAPAQEIDLFEPVSAAALFALVLSLQGRDEHSITLILDQVLDEQTPQLPDTEAVRTWLATLQQRLNSVLAQEAA